MDLSNCGSATILKAIFFIKEILSIILLIIPIILILLLAIDIIKLVIGKDENDQKIIIKLAIKRVIYAIIIFFVPTIIGLVNSILESLGVNYAVCLADVNKSAIEYQEKIEKAIEVAEREAYLTSLNITEDENTRILIEKSSNGSSSSNKGIKEEGCDGMVFYKNGTFYKPTYSAYSSGKPETKGSGKYGYNKYFYQMLVNFENAATQAGYSVRMSTSEYGAWRSYELQEHYYNCYISKSCNNGNLAAKPGQSNHGWGIASDLKYGNSAATSWAQKNAEKYGLKFGVPSENWHVQPLSTKTDDSVVEKCK